MRFTAPSSLLNEIRRGQFDRCSPYLTEPFSKSLSLADPRKISIQRRFSLPQRLILPPTCILPLTLAHVVPRDLFSRHTNSLPLNHALHPPPPFTTMAAPIARLGRRVVSRAAPWLAETSPLGGASSVARRFSSVAGGSATSESHATSSELITMEEKSSAHNYHPLPVVFAEAHGARITDPEGREYLDFLSAYSAVNQGHGNARILAALQQQAERCTLSSRAFHNDRFPLLARRITALMGYERVLPMNTGAEAVETALKVARKWAYEKKGVPANEALVISCCGCFHGRTMAAISMSCDNDATRGFGPLLPGNLKVDFGDVDGLQRLLEEHGPRVAAFIVEPIQGEAGVVVPPEGYLRAVRQLCSEHRVLLLADEIQTGLARTGKMLACDHEGVRPDVLILGKALGGGVVPVSAVLADDDVMGCIRPGEHGSTFGGNPLASSVALAALAEIEEGGLADRAQRLGEQLQAQLKAVQARYPQLIQEVRGRGLLVAVQVAGEGLPGGVTALDVCVAMKERGVLAKPTHNTIIRLAPPSPSRACPIRPPHALAHLCPPQHSLLFPHHTPNIQSPYTPYPPHWVHGREEELGRAAAALEAVLGEDMPRLVAQAGAAGADNKTHSKQPCDRCGRVR
ncbi:unnamed protein product [Closterium sp. Yama58-4]|nr:unnamed protein product [Closterium sp. Yama58-4]